MKLTNKEIAKTLDFTAKLMEIHAENKFKIRAYQNAYNTIRNETNDLTTKSFDELIKIKGLGKGTAQNIVDLVNTSSFPTLDRLLERTPPGILEIMKIKGIGAKKVRQIWDELGVESLGELEYAIKENRLTLLKGFGEKTQKNILKQIYFLGSIKGFYLLSEVEEIGSELVAILKNKFPNEKLSIAGELRRKMPFTKGVELIGTIKKQELISALGADIIKDGNGVKYKNIVLNYTECSTENFGSTLLHRTGPSKFVEMLKIETSPDEQSIFEKNALPYIPSKYRDNLESVDEIKEFDEEKYIDIAEIKGVIHNHTHWSDGLNSVMEMAKYSKEKGYKYLVITDHSKSAFYANGITNERLTDYIEDIRNQDKLISDFKIYAGIESDILPDGSLDYDDDKLKLFDVVVASIHSSLNMDKETATNRIINAIKNPYTKILGHMTSRILLAREGYPLDYEKIFEACVEHNVAIELNANPHRLDIDWTFLKQAQDTGVKICISPDAHSINQIDNIKYGVIMAQKGLLLKENCINLKSQEEFEKWL